MLQQEEGLMPTTMSMPVVTVPTAKVIYSAGEMKVVYVLEVAYQGRKWKIEKGYSEIKKFRQGLAWQDGLFSRASIPCLPPGGLTHKKTNKSWLRIEKRRAALGTFFMELEKSEAFYRTTEPFFTFFDIDENMCDLTQRLPPPSILNTSWWYSTKDIQDAVFKITRITYPPGTLPPNVVLCTPTGMVKRDEDGIVISFKAAKGTSRTDQRARLNDVASLYGWITSFGDVVPPATEISGFMRHLFRKRGSLAVDRWSAGSDFSSSSSLNSSSVNSTSSQLSDCVYCDIKITPPPPQVEG
eukprot:TRINITY_DN10538_c0_g2_i1.p1 TRINITY_DN10538_c0_g2~~TRINITY_DN10538_c0_g2_i1.p1  ORF type:complete len:311 (+),score=44.56 TRINITY_DN10538_c0_g2_i1:40-933(+)